MKTRTLKEITLHKRAWKKVKKNTNHKPIVALDTETERGKAFVIGLTKQAYSTNAELHNINDFLQFIHQQELNKSDNFFWNLTYDTNAIIKHLTIKQLITLSEKNELVTKKYTIKIIPDKALIIKHRRRKYKFYDIAQFYNRMSLDNAGEKFLNTKKIVFDVTNLSAQQYFTNKEYKTTINKYLERDTELTYKLAERLINTIKEFMNPKYYYSQASLSQQYFLENMNRDYKLPPKPVLELSLRAYNGGRFEVFKKGTFKKVSSYDIRSAYPYQNINIPALDCGEWVQNKKYEEKALVSLIECDVEGESIISPLKAEYKGMIYYPVGKKRLVVNKQEYEVIKEYGYDIKIINAYHYFDDNPEYPYEFLKMFYDRKEALGKEHPNYIFYKIIINGFYGKTIQLQEKTELTEEDDVTIEELQGQKRFMSGLLFNPVVAQEITANTRSMLLRAVKDIQENVVAFATDSIITLKKPNITIGKNLGEWDVEHDNERFTSIGSGVYFFEGDRMKFRGFGRGYNPVEVLHSQNEQVTVPIKKNIKLKECFRRKEKDFDAFNIITESEKTLNLNFDSKREWLDSFNNTHEVYNKQISSKPLRVEE